MTIFQGIILGVIQGIAEFLPISSSGHLALAQKLFGLDDVPLLFDVFLHLATLCAVILFFRKKIAALFGILFRWILRKPAPEKSYFTEDDLLCGTEERGRKTIIALILTTFVTGIIGVCTSKLIDDGAISIKVTCVGFIITAVLLITSALIEKRNSKKEDINASASTKESENQKGISCLQALFIGLMQGFGTLPGISRSGSTIAGAQFSKVNRTSAGEYSFIVSIPAILGAFILELKDLKEVSSAVGILPLIAGCASALAWGYLSLSFLMKLIKNGKLIFFALYLIPLGILGLLFL